MQNGSVRLNVGDVVLPGDVIGGVGNTGMTSDREKGGITAWYEGKKSGYHMDLKVKINGKYVDPEKFYVAPEAQKSYTGPTREAARNLPMLSPQQAIQPQVQQDPYADFWDVLNQFISADDVLFRSNDIFDTTGRFGGGF